MQQWVQQTQFLNRLLHQNRNSKVNKPNLSIERYFWSKGFEYICGIDEAGRGALAGPLVSAAVILPQISRIKVDDSKKLDKKKKKIYESKIKIKALDWAIGIATLEEINSLGIQEATYLSYKRAIEKLDIKPDLLFLDYFEIPDHNIKQFSLAKGDEISSTIASASILAKQARDKMMKVIGSQKNYEKYNFSRNFGYGTKSHYRALQAIGPSDLHRCNFYPIDEMLALRFDLFNR